MQETFNTETSETHQESFKRKVEDLENAMNNRLAELKKQGHELKRRIPIEEKHYQRFNKKR